MKNIYYKKGEKHKIEAHLSVRHALKVHEGKYQCNNLHSSYHTLRVHSPPIVEQKPMTISPFLLHPIGNSGNTDDSSRHYSTESGYATIHDLASSQSNDDDLFTRTWEPIDPESPPQILALPTKKPLTVTTTTGQHHASHHHHYDHLPHVQQMEHDMKHKLFYINTTNFDGNPLAADVRHHNRTKIGLVNLDLNPPPTPPTYYTTELKKNPQIYYAATPPSFPPPRTTPSMMTSYHTSHPSAIVNTYNEQKPPYLQVPDNSMGIYPHKSHEGYHMGPATRVGQTQHPVQTMQPPPPYYPHYPTTPQQSQINTMLSFPAHMPPISSVPMQTTTTLYQNPFQQYNQMPSPPQYNVPNSAGSIVATSAPIFGSSSAQGSSGHSHSVDMTSTISSGTALTNQAKPKANGELPNFGFYC